jgi:hypothetical protein
LTERFQCGQDLRIFAAQLLDLLAEIAVILGDGSVSAAMFGRNVASHALTCFAQELAQTLRPGLQVSRDIGKFQMFFESLERFGSCISLFCGGHRWSSPFTAHPMQAAVHNRRCQFPAGLWLGILRA